MLIDSATQAVDRVALVWRLVLCGVAPHHVLVWPLPNGEYLQEKVRCLFVCRQSYVPGW